MQGIGYRSRISPRMKAPMYFVYCFVCGLAEKKCKRSLRPFAFLLGVKAKACGLYLFYYLRPFAYYYWEKNLKIFFQPQVNQGKKKGAFAPSRVGRGRLCFVGQLVPVYLRYINQVIDKAIRNI